MRPSRWPRVIVGLGLTATLVTFGAAPAEAAPRTGTDTVFVEFDDTSVFADYSSALPRGRDIARRAAADARTRIDAAVNRILGSLRGAEGERELYRTSNAVPGVAVRADPATVRRLVTTPGVRSVRRITPARPSNSAAAQLGRAMQTWQDTGLLGDGVRIGIIDTGIDYTHADLGGPGTIEAYDAARAGRGTFPTEKVVGGVDLAGDDYDSSSSDPARSVPHPDDDPLDCGGHGTHVAGTAAGYGENADGTTFTGDYRALTPAALDGMRIGPGSAPAASLYAIRIFGCEGSTALTPAGLDRALDPDGDGDFDDRLDVVNLSLGSDFAAPDDPVNEFVQKLVDNGVVVVAAAGNAGDVFDAGTAPSNSPDVLAVGNVRDAGVLLDGAEQLAPEARTVSGQYSVNFARVPDVTGDVVALSAANAQGCAPYSAADAARAAGNIVWLDWPDADSARPCGSVQRAEEASAAGAVGAVLTSAQADFGSTQIGGTKDLPMFQLDAGSTGALRSALDAGTLRLHLDGTLAGMRYVSAPSIEDTISESSARGGRGPGVKPDVAAPGQSIVSAAVGTGSGRASKTGTSMASPFVAGVAALVRQAHPDRTPQEIKAAIVDTADGDVHAGENHAGPVFAPMRVGAGRVDAAAAVRTTLLAGNATDPGAVGVAFGAVEAPPGEPLERRARISVRNTGDSPAALDVDFKAITTMPGVTIEASPSRIRVLPGLDETVDVRLTVDPQALRRTPDPTLELTQDGQARQYLADASGLVTLVPTDGSPTLRVPVTSAPKPVSSLTATAGDDGVRLSGTGVDQGSGRQAYRSRAGVFRLLATSPELPLCDAQRITECVANETGHGGDLRYVGVARSGDTIGVAVSMWGPLPDVGATTVPSVEFDVDGDGVPDHATGLVKEAGTDVLVARTVDLAHPLTGGGFSELDARPVNGFTGVTDTNVFDTDTWVLPVSLSALGIDPHAAAAPLRMRVRVEGDYGPIDVSRPDEEGSDAPVDVAEVPGRWDPLADGPGAEQLLSPADDGTTLAAPADAPLLVVLTQNPAGEHAVALGSPSSEGEVSMRWTPGRVFPTTPPTTPGATPA
ncbi:S8 family serine peptidase [Pseudonocardia sp.]|uniref:S8 family peptidase n=1 Tax=Pseudonocardia sp. TaxID=60912 RepID=UPI0031FDAA73